MKSKKIVIILIFIILLSFSNIVMADNFDLNQFEDGNEVPEEVTNLTKGTLETGIAITRVVAVGGLIISLTAIAIKYMVSSAGDRADIKKHAIAFVTAAIIIFGSTYIIEALIGLSSKINEE